MITWIICWALGSRGKVGREFVYRTLDYLVCSCLHWKEAIVHSYLWCYFGINFRNSLYKC